MARQRMQADAVRRQPFGIGQQGVDRLLAHRHRVLRPEQAAVRIGQKPGVGIGGAAQHDAIDRSLRQQGIHSIQIGNAAIQHDAEVRPGRLQCERQLVAQRRHFTVLFRAEALEPGLARMDDEDGNAGERMDDLDETHEGVVVLVVDPDAALDRYRDRNCLAHRAEAVADKLRLRHQAGSESAFLHTVARAATVQVDLVIAKALADARCLGKHVRVAPPELQRDGVLDRIEAE